MQEEFDKTTANELGDKKAAEEFQLGKDVSYHSVSSCGFRRTACIRPDVLDRPQELALLYPNLLRLAQPCMDVKSMSGQMGP